MKLLTPHSIKNKLFMLLFGAVLITILSASALFYFQITKIYRQSYRQDLKTQAVILGANCQAALTFDLPEDARAVLGKLAQHPSVTAATIYDNRGRIFTHYSAAGGAVRAGRMMVIRQPITFKDHIIGRIELRDNLLFIHQFRNRLLGSLLVIMSILLAAALLIVQKLSAVVSKPLRELAHIAEQVARDQDYSRRVSLSGHDEIGQLGSSLNTMLQTIDEKTAEIMASENRFKMLLEQGVDAFFMHDGTGRFVNVNQQACNSLGYSKDELLQMTVADVDAESVPRQDMEKVWHSLEDGRVITFESNHKRRDGTVFPVEVRMRSLQIGGQTYFMGLARDITERFAALEEKHSMEMQLQQAQKMESIGTLAGGIAHDFNNILSAIFGYSELARMDVEPDSKIAGYLGQIRTAGERAADLVKQILTFSRKQQEEKAPLQISLIVKEALKLLRASIPATIRIEQDISSSARILADSTQIHQVLMNLCTNAYHAMADQGGVLAVTLKEVDVDGNGLDKVDEIPSGHYVVLSVSDTGSGMNKETLAKIFEPYFTTKEKGRGTGLGLSVVHGIVKGHHGRIGVYSEPGQGTTFNVYLPVIIAELQEKTVAKPPPPAHGERVMVVDDEEAIRTLHCKFLNEAGYRAECFANGHEAWDALAADPAAWDILVTDRTMPEMTGPQLIAKIRGVRPDLPIVLCSGYNSETDGANDWDNEVVKLAKPVDRLSLLNCLAGLRPACPASSG